MIIPTCQSYVSMAGARTRLDIYTVISHAPTSVQEKLRQMVFESIRHGEGKHLSKKIRVDHDQYSKPQRELGSTKVCDGNHDIMMDDERSNQGCFMKAGSEEVVNDLIVNFIDWTGNAAMAMGVCAVCARETFKRELTGFNLDAIPSRNRLFPAEAHPAHDLFNGMLLHPTGVSNDKKANVCMECIRALDLDRVPTFSLANRLWIGRVPHELAYLTLPERLLIAKYFPAAYIIKLYPKKKGARHWDKRQMYSGLKGNVSTYRLDQGQISSMIDGTILPQRPDMLVATIGITFVGPKNIPDAGLPDMFKVRRGR